MGFRPKDAVRQAAGFTLLELLGVIGIIAVLVALLFPVFRRVKDSANSATCVSNLRQFGAANGMYAADHDGWMTPCVKAGQSFVTNFGAQRIMWFESLLPYVGGPDQIPSGFGDDFAMPGSYFCPSSQIFGSGQEIFDNNGTPGFRITSYAYNARIGGYTIWHGGAIGDAYADRKVFNCPNPAKIVMMADSIRVYFDQNQNNWENAFPQRHAGGDNVLYVDGHVDRIDASTISKEEWEENFLVLGWR
ncbi:type II secretion system protein [Coraliomargarita parva]|uniref:type II secretion system protein n=1 Tax=Coraliomargarita parva TaxID=3014050 RepID=UPI0022B48EEA|nr:type II secretion system protein [Coraliomargarita parva]